MKKIEIKFTTVLIIALILILTAISIYMYNAVKARYEMNKQIQIAYTTPDYYFDVTTDVTEITAFPATINITAKNNNGTSYTSENLTYTIGVDNANYTITPADGKTTRTLAGGSATSETYAVTINKTGTDSSDKINLVITLTTPYVDTINKELEISTIPAYYGALVTNYSAGGVSAWRVFHKDEEGRVYLITDDYIEKSQIPASTAGNILNHAGSCGLYFKNILNDYTGSDWIIANTNPNAQKWLSGYLTAYPSSTNANMKAVAYMMDTNSWSKFIDNTYAEYAIGGPTLELFCASYKKTHPDRYIECDSVLSSGYKIKWSDGTYTSRCDGLIKDEYNKIYMNSDASKAFGVYIASPVNVGNFFINCSDCGGGFGYSNINGGNVNSVGSKYCGFRSIVCLKSGVDIVSNGDGTYRIT